MFERFTTAARGAVVSAQGYAREFRHPEIGAEHVLLGVLADEQGVAARVLRGLGVDPAAVRSEVQTRVMAFGSPDVEALRAIGIDLEAVRRQAEETFGAGALDRPRRQRTGLFRHRSSDKGHIPFTTEAKSALEQSLRAALALGHNYIGTEHILLGLLATKRGTALDVLRRVGLEAEVEAIRHQVSEELRRTA
jgi:ATP-dependent Clp protease ATP-binding subunit ClpA